jgi:hypothetical protein
MTVNALNIGLESSSVAGNLAKEGVFDPNAKPTKGWGEDAVVDIQPVDKDTTITPTEKQEALPSCKKLVPGATIVLPSGATVVCVAVYDNGARVDTGQYPPPPVDAYQRKTTVNA